jgi:hypothetical protein
MLKPTQGLKPCPNCGGRVNIQHVTVGSKNYLTITSNWWAKIPCKCGVYIVSDIIDDLDYDSTIYRVQRQNFIKYWNSLKDVRYAMGV